LTGFPGHPLLDKQHRIRY